MKSRLIWGPCWLHRQVFYGILVQHFANLAGSKPLPMDHLDSLTVHLMDFTAEVPFYAATVAQARLKRLQQRLSTCLTDPVSILDCHMLSPSHNALHAQLRGVLLTEHVLKLAPHIIKRYCLLTRTARTAPGTPPDFTSCSPGNLLNGWLWCLTGVLGRQGERLAGMQGIAAAEAVGHCVPCQRPPPSRGHTSRSAGQSAPGAVPSHQRCRHCPRYAQ